MIKVSQDEAVKQKDSLLMEVNNLQSELQQVRDDRDRHVVQSQKLAGEILMYKESVGKSSHELDILIAKSGSLEVSQSRRFTSLPYIFNILTMSILCCRKHVRCKKSVLKCWSRN